MNSFVNLFWSEVRRRGRRSARKHWAARIRVGSCPAWALQPPFCRYGAQYSIWYYYYYYYSIVYDIIIIIIMILLLLLFSIVYDIIIIICINIIIIIYIIYWAAGIRVGSCPAWALQPPCCPCYYHTTIIIN